MDIAFRANKIEKIFNSEKLLDKEYGKENATKIKRRMAVLRTAPTLEHVPIKKPERRHELKGNRVGEFAVDLKHPSRLIFIPNHDPIPCNENAEIDLAKVTSVKIIKVEDYHK